MTLACANDYTEQDLDDHEAGPPDMQRMKRKAQPRRSKYLKKQRPVRRGIKQRRVRRVMW